MRGTIESLVLFAEKLPQHQYKQLFTDESLEPLIKAIMLRKVEPGFQDRSNIAKDPIKFRIGCMLLTWALGIDSVLKNPYAQKLWMEKMLPMRSLVDALYDDMKRERV